MKRVCRSINIGPIENFEPKTMLLNRYCLLTKHWSKDNMVQTTESSKKVLNGKEYSSTHTFVLKNFGQETIWFNPFTHLRKFWPKDNMVQPILPFKKIFTKRQYDLTDIAV